MFRKSSPTQACVFLLIVLMAGCSYGRSVPDSEISALLDSRRGDLETLRDLMHENPQIVSAGMSSVRITKGSELVEARSIEKYRFEDPIYNQIGQLQQSLGVRGGIYHCPSQPQIVFLFIDCRTEREGLMPISWCKGLAHSPSSPSPLVRSLAGAPSETDEMGRAYVGLADDWYIVWENWSDPRARCGEPKSS